MKTNYLLIALLGFILVNIYGQGKIDSLTVVTEKNSNISFWNAYADKIKLTAIEKKEFLNSHQRQILNPNTTIQKQFNFSTQNNTMAGPCVNIDFENGNLSGWNTSCGFHPIFNPLGCCPNPGGQQTIMIGAALDPAGGFPIVAPGGNFSLRLGNNLTGGEADRIEQTFLVNLNNCNFKYRYAVVFQDPGHISSQQPAFQVEMLDSLGLQIPCTYYNVAAGGSIPGFFNSPNLAGVVFKPWSDVVVDLTNYIGQNVTIRFTTFDCALGGHYGYAYIDGSCLSFIPGYSDSVCIGSSKAFCAPSGFGTYTWNGPGIVNSQNLCINASNPGIYTCQTTLYTGCNGPQFTYTLSNYPNPIASFNSQSANACSTLFTFSNSSTISSGFISNYSWNFNNTTTVTLQNPTFNFPGTGTYSINLTAISNQSCTSSNSQTLTISPYPVASFSAPSLCENSVINFTNHSSILSGSITNYTWNFGGGNQSGLIHPNYTFSGSGIFLVTLSVTSNQNCVSSFSNNVVIYPNPIASFSNNDVCLGSPTLFNNNSSIVTGNIVSYNWLFDTNANITSNLINPSYNYVAATNYTASLLVLSNYNCASTFTKVVVVHSLPITSFNVNNNCFGVVTTFTNSSSIAQGNTIVSYLWDFGNQQFSTVTNPQITFLQPSNYSVNLTTTSNFGCSSSQIKTVMIYDLPNVVFNSTAVCFNQPTNYLNASSISNGNIIKYRWDFENDGIWDDTLSLNPSKVFGSAGVYNTKMEATSNNLCNSVKINSVVVYANPIAKLEAKSVCYGSTTNFSNTSISIDGPITNSKWDFNNDNIIDNQFYNANYNYTSSGVFTVNLIVQTIYGCTNSYSKAIVVNPNPEVNFIAPIKQGCENLCVNFINQSSISSGNIKTYEWDFGDGSLPNNNLNPTHCFGKGKYDIMLKLISDSGCIRSLAKSEFISVYSNPIANFKVEPYEIDELEPLAFISNASENVTSINYYINDGFSISQENFNYNFSNIDKIKPIVFQVVTNEFGCSDTISKIINVKPSWTIYVPNTFTPNDDGLNDGFFAKGYNIKKFTISIYDRWGHLLFISDSFDDYWDGKTKNSNEVIKQDVYVWKINAVDIFNKSHDLIGHVTLLK